MKHKEQITLYQESHRKPGYLSGDVIIVLKQKLIWMNFHYLILNTYF